MDIQILSMLHSIRVTAVGRTTERNGSRALLLVGG